VKSTYFSTLAAIVVLLTLGINVSAEDRLLQTEPDSFVKLGDIKGEYRSDPDSFVKLGDIKGEYRSDPDSFVKLGDIKGDYKTGTLAQGLRSEDLLRELDYLIWEAEADDFYWRCGQLFPNDDMDQRNWVEESGDF
jgi:hypothetical protein